MSTLQELGEAIKAENALAADRRNSLDELLIQAQEIERQIDIAIDEVADSKREVSRLRKQKSRLQKNNLRS